MIGRRHRSVSWKQPTYTANIKMGGNLMTDLVIGSIPLAGNVFDIFFKANKRNVTLMEEFFAERARLADGEQGERE